MHALGAPTQLARRLRPAQQQYAHQRRLRPAEVEGLAESVFVLGDTALGRARCACHAQFFEPVDGLGHDHAAAVDPDLSNFELAFVRSNFAVFLALHIGFRTQAILSKLVPWKLAPELSDRCDERLEALRQLVARAARHGIGIYLYFNEPRAMPLAFYERWPQLRGVEAEGFAALCTSTPEVQEFLRESAAAVFAAVPGLAGAFTISMSENLTNCYSKGRGHECPRCGKRPPADVVAEVNRCLAEGVWRSRPDARFLAWDWGWAEEWAEAAIAQLPPPAWLMCVSEWSLPIERGGVAAAIGEYSISAPGPGPRALRHWAAARRRGLKIAAKVQLNNTWELSAVPYIPALELVAEHLGNLTATGGPGVNGLMLGWTLGGYPSPNLDLLEEFARSSAPKPAVAAVARRRFGEQALPYVTAAWHQFSAAFREFPYHIGVVYGGPQQMGPANLLFRQPTGYRASMVCYPYDDLETWRAIYPPEVFQGQFEKVADGWEKGLEQLEVARAVAPSAALEAEWRVAKAAWLHFSSVANQIAFVRCRGNDWPRCRRLLEEEIQLARELFDLVNRDSRLGFEATNHYYYTRLDLAEKILNCRQLLEG